MKDNGNKNKNNYPSPTKDFNNVYDVPRDFDKTPRTLLSLDNYLLDYDIFSLVKQLYPENTNWSEWAQLFRDDAETFFSRPYFNRRSLFLLGFKTNNEE
jgi:hypothetical protein